MLVVYPFLLAQLLFMFIYDSFVYVMVVGFWERSIETKPILGSFIPKAKNSFAIEMKVDSGNIRTT